MKRLFLAIAAQQGLEETGQQIIKKLKINADQKKLDVRWVPMSNYHVTLVFLGETASEKIPEIETLMSEVSSRIAPFDLKISNVGAFPDEFSSRVLWFGVQNSKSLRYLQSELSSQFHEKNYLLEDRAYSPHLTIARLRNPHKTKDLISPFVRKNIAKIPITEIVLYESVGRAPFPVYKALKKFLLCGTEPKEVSEDY